MINKEIAYQKIAELVKRFDEQYDSYKNSNYNETLTRRDFIDPFFKALGWDVDNEEGYAESYREVIHEDKIKISGATKAPDYSFRLVGGKRLFFVEAKKPSVVIKDDILPAYQVRRYGWNSKLAISIVTDFEEFAIYDCTRKPVVSDKASVARIEYFRYNDYLNKFDFIWDTFSKEHVLKGSFDKFIQGTANKKGTTTVDKEFLKSLDTWRTYLATSVSWNNKNLNEEEINFVVQQTIDRIIFLRIAEDRNVEPYGNLKDALKQGDYYKNLFKIFKEADDKYNSGLFDFKKDGISEHLKIENKIIKNIIEELYFPKCEYEFAVMPVEILGTAYEQFLGKVIRITPSHHAKIEEKPEVRKAGGVYYTPQYIVDYIVKNTVGKLVDGKTPKEISKITIVDPACGSGSFLIGAYQYLLDYHKNYYSKNGKPAKAKNERAYKHTGNPLTPAGHLTTAEKKRILINNIYGVDIDVNAVEVTKLSLLLKCMEGETSASITYQLSMFNERVLPTLENNIKCGNSLIDTDYYSDHLDSDVDKKIKPFNWQKAFPHVFNVVKETKAQIVKPDLGIDEEHIISRKVKEPIIVYSTQQGGGFDCVIGNPPYVNLVSVPEEQRNYLQNHYKTCKNKCDLYSFFLERACVLTKQPIGKFGFIVPHTWLATESFELLRKKLLNEFRIESISEMGFKVFDGVTVSTVILICSFNNKTITVNNKDFAKRFSIPSKKWIDDDFHIDLEWNSYKENIYNKLSIDTVQLEKIIQFSRGLKTSDDNRFIHSESKNKDYKPVYRGRNIKAYSLNWTGEYIWYRPDLMKEKVGCLPHSKDFFEVSEKLVTQRVNSSMQLLVAYDNCQNYFLDTTNVSKYSSWDKVHSMKFIMGLLNSRLINYWYCNKYKMPTIGLYELHSIPFKIINFKKSDERVKYDEIIKLVDQLLKLNKEKSETKLQSKIEQLQNKIDYCEDRINEIVYELYGLTKDEIKIVEGK